ncbi:MAG: PKD domain-containing protein [Solirubrobacteraceae bacterium]
MHPHNRLAGRRSGTAPCRRLAFVAVLVAAALGSVTASAAADQQIVTATVYSSSGTQQESLTLAALEANSNQCLQYTGTLPVQHGQSGQTTTPNFTGGQVWALSTILSCLQPAIPSGAVKGVTIIQADGTPETAPGSQLTAADLAPGSTDFADPSEAPVIGNQGTASDESIQYDRPWRGGGDNNFNDQVTEPAGSPVALEVFEGQLLTVTPQASATTVPAGGSVSFNATFEPSNVSGVTYSWNFDGGAANSTASAPTVTFTTGGTYKVTVQVTDDEGGGGAASIPVTVTSRNQPPSGNDNGPPTGPHNSGGNGGQVPRKHRRGNGGQGHNGSTKHGSTGGQHSNSTTSASHGGTTPAASTGPGTTTPAQEPSSPTVTRPAKTHSAAPPTRDRQQTPHLKAAPPPAPSVQAPVVTGRLVSDVTPLPAGESPLVRLEAGVPATSQAARSRVGGSPVGPIVGGLSVLALLALGARRELRGKRNWRTLRFGS